MHELSVTEGLLSIINEEARKSGARRVAGINLVIGELACIIDESVQFYFDILSRGTLAEGAVLSFRKVPAEYQCRCCGHLFQKRTREYRCPICGGPSVILDRGREFYIDSIEVDSDEN